MVKAVSKGATMDSELVLGTATLGRAAAPTAAPQGDAAPASRSEVSQQAEVVVSGSGEKYRSLGDWLGDLGEEERVEASRLFEQETQGLKRALKAEREARGGLEKRLRELSKEVEAAAPATAAQLEALGADLAGMRRRVAFYEGAPADLWNARLGWLAAQEIGAFDEGGNVEWEALRGAFPELFGSPEGYHLPMGAIPAGAGAGAGAGTGASAGKLGGVDMNQAIRRAAGRRRGGA